MTASPSPSHHTPSHDTPSHDTPSHDAHCHDTHCHDTHCHHSPHLEASESKVSETGLSLTVAILRAAHCRSTHHYFAVDALPLARTAAGRRFVGHLMQHHRRYLTGAKDPDTRFRDFQNHVVHVEDDFWGGAPRVAHQWYNRLLRYLTSDRYSDAAHAAGVLSHYFTDPIQPLHTAQSDLEQVLHRPIEWSITKSYSELFEKWKQNPQRVLFQLSDQPDWLGDAIRQAAKVAHRQYASLLNQYDLVAGRRDPPAGLPAPVRDQLADLIGLAVTGWARVLERAAWEAEQRLQRKLSPARPAIGLVLAGIRTPTQWWLRRIQNAAEQRAVEALIMDFQQHGRLNEHLPDEQRVLAKVRKIRQQEKAFTQRRNLQQRELQPARVAATEATNGRTPTSSFHSPEEKPEVTETDIPGILPFRSFDRSPGRSGQKPRLTLTDPLVDAPSIGPKTAARFSKIDIHTVHDFLTADAAAMVDRLNTRWITSDTLHAWRCQAMLMCQLPGMLAREVQLLVGAGYRTADSIGRVDAAKLFEDVSRYASGYQGRRHLRGADPPTLHRIEQVVGEAALAMVQQKRGLGRTEQSNQEAEAESPKQLHGSADAVSARTFDRGTDVGHSQSHSDRPEDQAAA